MASPLRTRQLPPNPSDPPISPHPPKAHTNDHRSSDSTWPGYVRLDSRIETCSDIKRHLGAMTLSAKVWSSDVFLSLSSRKPPVLRLAKWIRAELEMNGISCFVSDRRRYLDAHAHSLAQKAMDTAVFGVLLLTRRSFSNPYTIEEMKVFSDRRLVPIFFGIPREECNTSDIIGMRGDLWEKSGGELWSSYGGVEDDWKTAVEGLSHADVQLEANSGNFRNCVLELVSLIGNALGKRCVVENVKRWRGHQEKELPYQRNFYFVGRKKEMQDIEVRLFGDVEGDGKAEATETITHSRHSSNSNMRKSSTIRNLTIRERRDGKEPMSREKHEQMINVEGVHGQCVEFPCGKGIVCVSGESGFGKTELLLEFAYRHAQRYKMILWVGGESRYVRHNFMKLLPILGIDVSVEVEDELYQETNGKKNFEEIESEAILKVHKELMRDVPFLLVIDNLESEQDWNRKSIIELLPHLGRETHVIISTRLPHIMNIEPVRLISLSEAEGMSLMKGIQKDLDAEENNALRIIERRLSWLPLGLALVGAIISDLQMKPSKLLGIIEKTPFTELTYGRNEDTLLVRNPYVVLLLDVCFSIFDLEERPKKLAKGMVEASSWFGPAPIPITLLALAAEEGSEEHNSNRFWSKFARKRSGVFMTQNAEATLFEAEVSSMLVKSRIARNCTKPGYIYFHDIIKSYARRIGNIGVAEHMIRAIRFTSFDSYHSNHIWAACFLVFKFDNNPVLVNLTPADMVSFIKNLVLPLAMYSFSTLSRCTAAMELLRVSTDAVEALEKTVLSQARRARTMSSDILHQDLAQLKKTLLETSGIFLLKGRSYC